MGTLLAGQQGTPGLTIYVLSCHVRSDVRLTSDLRSPDETDEAAGSITRLRFVGFTSNFVHIPPRKALENRACQASHFLQFFIQKFYLTGKPDEIQLEMMGNGLQEEDTQKLHRTPPGSTDPSGIRNYSSV
jgi:hypothetical protein